LSESLFRNADIPTLTPIAFVVNPAPGEAVEKARDIVTTREFHP
jgi:hypothetical protein